MANRTGHGVGLGDGEQQEQRSSDLEAGDCGLATSQFRDLGQVHFPFASRLPHLSNEGGPGVTLRIVSCALKNPLRGRYKGLSDRKDAGNFPLFQTAASFQVLILRPVWGQGCGAKEQLGKCGCLG